MLHLNIEYLNSIDEGGQDLVTRYSGNSGGGGRVEHAELPCGAGAAAELGKEAEAQHPAAPLLGRTDELESSLPRQRWLGKR